VYKTYTSHVRYLDSYLHSYTGFPVAHSQNQTPRLFLIWASRRTWQLSLTIDRKILILRLHCLIYIGHGQYNSVMCVIYSFGIRILYKIHYFVVYARVKCYHRNQGTALPWMSWYSVMMENMVSIVTLHCTIVSMVAPVRTLYLNHMTHTEKLKT